MIFLHSPQLQSICVYCVVVLLGLAQCRMPSIILARGNLLYYQLEDGANR